MGARRDKMFKINEDQIKRDKLLRPKYRGNSGYGIFENLNVHTLRYLINNSFIAPDYRWNEAPTAMEFFNFMMVHKEYKAHGWTKNIECQGCMEYGFIIEGLKGIPQDTGSRDDLRKFSEKADEWFEYPDGSIRTWYD